MRSSYAALYALTLTAACPAPPTSLARATQTAQEFNLNARFGRADFLMERVAPDERAPYTATHRSWGSGLRVADVELAGLQPRGDHDVDVLVRVAWYRPEDQQLRSTTLQQSWHDKPEGWQLVAERRVDGEMGLLGESVVYAAPEARSPAQFPTVRLGGNE
jgi:hypothetical protein